MGAETVPIPRNEGLGRGVIASAALAAGRDSIENAVKTSSAATNASFLAGDRGAGTSCSSGGAVTLPGDDGVGVVGGGTALVAECETGVIGGDLVGNGDVVDLVAPDRDA